MNHSIQTIGIALAICAVCAPVWAQAPSQKASAAFTRAGLNPERQLRALPDFPPVPLANVPNAGDKVNLATYQGSVVLLNIWATWCDPCRSEMPSMEKIYQRYRSKGLVILALNLQEGKTKVDAFMKQNRLSFPALLDSSGTAGNLYGVRAIPASYILDRQGRVVVRLTGSIDWDRPELHTALDALLAE